MADINGRFEHGYLNMSLKSLKVDLQAIRLVQASVVQSCLNSLRKSLPAWLSELWYTLDGLRICCNSSLWRKLRSKRKANLIREKCNGCTLDRSNFSIVVYRTCLYTTSDTATTATGSPIANCVNLVDLYMARKHLQYMLTLWIIFVCLYPTSESPDTALPLLLLLLQGIS